MTKNKQVKEVLSFLQKNRLDSIVLGVGALSLIVAITGIVLHSITLSKSVPAKKKLYKELADKRDADIEAQKTAFTTKYEELIATRNTAIEDQKTDSITTYGAIEISNIISKIELLGKIDGEPNEKYEYIWIYKYKIADKKEMTFDKLVAESTNQGCKLNTQLFINDLDKKIELQKKIIYNNNILRYEAKKSYNALRPVAKTQAEIGTIYKPLFLATKKWRSSFTQLREMESEKKLFEKYDVDYLNKDIKTLLEPNKTFENALLEIKKEDNEKISEYNEAFNKALVHDEELVLGKVVEDHGYHANKVVNSSIGLGLAGVALIVLSLVLTSTAFKLWKKLRGGTKK